MFGRDYLVCQGRRHTVQVEYLPLPRALSKQHTIVVFGSVRKRLGRPADSRQAFSPARPGQSETDLGFSGQALEKPAGFMGAWRRL